MQGRSSPAHRLLPAALLLAGLGASIQLGLAVRDEIVHDAIVVFDNEADEVTSRLSDRLLTLELVLRGAAASFADPTDPLPNEWEIFTLQMQPQLTLPGVQAIGYSQLVRPDQVAAHIAKVQSWGFPDYAITPAGQRDLYTPAIFLEPLEGRNLRAFGYDMYSDPVRRAAMLRSLENGGATLSGKVQLMQETGTNDQAGVLMYFPLFLRGPALARTDPMAALQGWTAIALRMDDFVNGVLGSWRAEWSNQIALSIFDGTSLEPGMLLYPNASETPAANDVEEEQHYHKTINFHGQTWSLLFDFSPAFARIDYSQAWLVFGASSVISLLLYFLFWSLLSVSSRSQKLAAELTSEIREKQQDLVKSEFRWKFALEGAGDGVWDWDLASDRFYYSPRYQQMLGYPVGEFSDLPHELRRRIHPDDREAVESLVMACAAGNSDKFSIEYRLQAKDGTWIWVLDRGMLIKDDAGKPLRLLGTLKDVSDRKHEEEILKQKQRELLDAQRIAKVGNWVLDIFTNNVTWSDEMFYMMGLDPAGGAPNLVTQHGLFTADSWQMLQQAVSDTINQGKPYELELEIVRPDRSRAFMLAHGEAERGADGSVVRVRGTSADITSRVLARRRIELLGRLYATLSECNEAIVRCSTPAELLPRVCELLITHGRVAMAWIGMVDPATSRIQPMYSAGAGTDYLDGIQISVDKNDPHGMGPTGISTRENHPVWIEDFRHSSLTLSWQQRASNYGWLSSAALPLCLKGKPIGTLTFYSVEAGQFTPEVRSLLEEMTRNISFALDKFETEAESRRYQTTLIEAEQRFRSLVEQSLIGAFILQDRRFVYVNPYLETLLQYPHDDSLLQVPPAMIVSEADWSALQAKFDKLEAGEIGNLEHMFTAVRSDGARIEVGVTISGSSYQQKPAIIGLMQDLSNRKVAEAQIQRYANNLQQVFMQTVGMITNLVEMRDPYTVGHEKRVAELAVAIGRELKLSDHALEGLQIGGYLHDIGKVSVPGEILAKPGRITAIEFELIKGHPTAGYQILKEVEFPWPVAEIAYQHHERMDGSGYPRGLKGNEIMFEARIVAVADVVESMFSHRPYRPGLGLDKALAEVERGSGSIYDADVVAACLRIFRERGYTMPQ